MPVEYSITSPETAATQEAAVSTPSTERLFYRMDDTIFGQLKAIMGTRPQPGQERAVRTRAETQQLLDLGTGTKEGDADPNYFGATAQSEQPAEIGAPMAVEPPAEVTQEEQPVSAVEQNEEEVVIREPAEEPVETPVVGESSVQEPESLDAPAQAIELAAGGIPVPPAVDQLEVSEQTEETTVSEEQTEVLTPEQASQLTPEQINSRLAQMPEEARQDFLQDWADTEDKIQETVASIQSYQEEKRKEEGTQGGAPVIYEMDSEGRLVTEGEKEPEKTESQTQMESTDEQPLPEPELPPVEEDNRPNMYEVTENEDDSVENDSAEFATVTSEQTEKGQTDETLDGARRSSFAESLQAADAKRIEKIDENIEQSVKKNSVEKNRVDRLTKMDYYFTAMKELRRLMQARQDLDKQVGIGA